jgi:hypothetical protein
LYLTQESEGFDTTSLRQGDILAGIPFPLLDRQSLTILGAIQENYDYTGLPIISARTHKHRFDNEWVTAQLPIRFGLCAVLSNCCDLEPRNGKILARTITLARLRPVSADIRHDPIRFASLSSNKDPRDPVDPGYIDYFYLQSHTLLQNQDWNVEYSQCLSIPSSDINILLRKKTLQLNDRTRVKFKIKLAFTLGRLNNDEAQAGLENPWQEPKSVPTEGHPEQG